MTERPILFSAPMVRALLNGSKTMTRRVVKPRPDIVTMDGKAARWKTLKFYDRETRQAVERDRDENGNRFIEQINCPYGKPGDRLWVRETWAPRTGGMLPELERAMIPRYRADGEFRPEWGFMKWHPSIHMPRWASRIKLEITATRIERLQDISESDAGFEGVELAHPGTPSTWWKDYEAKKIPDALQDPYHGLACSAQESFASLWRSINGADSWDANPYVWVVEFRRIKTGAQP